MKKSKLLAALVCSASMLIGSVVPSVPAMADAMKVVTLGADLSEDQKNTMLRYFKVDSSQVQIIYVTNQDERPLKFLCSAGADRYQNRKLCLCEAYHIRRHQGTYSEPELGYL